MSGLRVDQLPAVTSPDLANDLIPIVDVSGNVLGTVKPNQIASGSVPTGTGFRHITGGVEDGSSKKVDLGDSADVTVPGADTRVLFRDGTVVGGDAGLTYNKTTDELSVTGGVIVGASGYYSVGTNPATAGVYRLANNAEVSSRNAANNANRKLLRMNASDQVILGDDSAGFAYWLLGQAAAAARLFVWNGSSFVNQLEADGTLLYAGVPVIGNSQPFGCHGRTVKAMGDANQTLSAAEYAREHIKFTGALTASRTMTFPHPSSEDRSYTKSIHHAGTGNSIVVSTGTGATITMAAGNRATLGFTPDGVIAIASFTVA